MMADLIAFLRARLDEDERDARLAASVIPPGEGWYRITQDAIADPRFARTYGLAYQHIARWDPARVLAEAAAKRAIIERHESNVRLLARATEHGDDQDRAILGIRVSESYWHVRLAAQPHAGHPDFDLDWRLPE